MRRILGKRFTLVLCLAILALASGCGQKGPSQGAISGAVSLDGKPIEHGSILFRPIEGTKGSVSGGQIENGRYKLSGVAAGWNRVEISAIRKTGRMVQKPFAKRGETVEEQAEAVAAQFNTNSTLKIDIKPGDNSEDFKVASK